MSDRIMKALALRSLCPGRQMKCRICDVCPNRCYGPQNCCRQMSTGTESALMELFSESVNQTEEVKTPSVNSTDDLFDYVTDVLHTLGVPANLKGHDYLREAIIRCINDDKLINHITRKLYPGVAAAFDTTPSRTERAIRHAVEVSWDRCSYDVLTEYFSNTTSRSKGKSTNSEFIALVSDKIRRDIRKINNAQQ